MLRNGKFIKEKPPKIGAHYIPQPNLMNLTYEEKFMQNVLLDSKIHKPSIVSKMLYLVLKA